MVPPAKRKVPEAMSVVPATMAKVPAAKRVIRYEISIALLKMRMKPAPKPAKSFANVMSLYI
jgi:hypothetical protein